MVKTSHEIKLEIMRLEDCIKFAKDAIEEFEADEPSVCHNFLVLKSKYKERIKVLKWVLNEG
jgi:hypothetical protein